MSLSAAGEPRRSDRGVPAFPAEALGRHGTLFLVVGLAFLARLWLAPVNSYWFDELYSVYTYGVANETGAQVVSKLARNSVHPPLYHLILFYWMEAFGDGETATRTLSNLYVAASTLCLYGIVAKTLGRRRAMMAVVLFSLMYMPIYYALEVRSYAQSLFLSSLSSLALVSWLRQAQASARLALKSGWLGVLVAANFALLMTHYYNLFFLAAQGLFLAGYGWLVFDRERLAVRLLKIVAIGASPLLLLLIAWGPVMAGRLTRRVGEFAPGGAATNPFSALMEMVIAPNFRVHWLLLAIVAALLLASYARFFFREQGSPHRRGFLIYLLVWACLPVFLASAAFFVTGSERFNSRYFIFSAPPLSVLLVLAVEQFVSAANRAVPRARAARLFLRHGGVVSIAVALLLLYPGAHLAATDRKTDWRGLALQITNLVENDRERRYLLFTTAFGRDGKLDYYLERSGGAIRTHDYVRRADEKSGEFAWQGKEREIAAHDTILLAFTHRPAREYPRAIAELERLYPLRANLLSARGRGLLVFDVGKNAARPPAPAASATVLQDGARN